MRNHVRAAVHQCERLCYQPLFFAILDMSQILDRESLRSQMREVHRLMPQPQLLNHLQVGRSPIRRRPLASRYLQIQRGQVPACKVVAQV